MLFLTNGVFPEAKQAQTAQKTNIIQNCLSIEIRFDCQGNLFVSVTNDSLVTSY